ncbi:hypothetical protein [Bradyrhizobium sp. STM 3809]|nr:hypothetical protein [Bradyrhizobium sp. STM 3809]
MMRCLARASSAWPRARGTIRLKRPTTTRLSGATRSIQWIGL